MQSVGCPPEHFSRTELTFVHLFLGFGAMMIFLMFRNVIFGDYLLADHTPNVCLTQSLVLLPMNLPAVSSPVIRMGELLFTKVAFEDWFACVGWLGLVFSPDVILGTTL